MSSNHCLQQRNLNFAVRSVVRSAVRSAVRFRPVRRDKSSTFGSRVFSFYTRLVPPIPPAGVTVMNPYTDREVRGYVRAFLDKFFTDNRERVLVFGINPGRFGAGIT